MNQLPLPNGIVTKPMSRFSWYVAVLAIAASSSTKHQPTSWYSCHESSQLALNLNSGKVKKSRKTEQSTRLRQHVTNPITLATTLTLVAFEAKQVLSRHGLFLE